MRTSLLSPTFATHRPQIAVSPVFAIHSEIGWVGGRRLFWIECVSDCEDCSSLRDCGVCKVARFAFNAEAEKALRKDSRKVRQTLPMTIQSSRFARKQRGIWRKAKNPTFARPND